MILPQLFCPEFNNINLNDVWFHQNGNTSNFANHTIWYLKKNLMIKFFQEMFMSIGNQDYVI